MGMLSCSDVQNQYFLDSADKISYFFEEHAFNEHGELTVDKNRAINKIGHALHILDEPYATFTLEEPIQQIAKDIGFIDPIVLQSMIICKQPKIGGVVTKHRDSTFLFTEPSTAVGFWFALEDCTTSNGCLYFKPGSHRDGASTRRFQRTGQLTNSINQNESSNEGGPNNSNITLTFVGQDKIDYPDEQFVAAEVNKGSLVIIHGNKFAVDIVSIYCCCFSIVC
jgi:ectoine hydroxylase-related dioxygenase (phytanoyl-CoA dioxygenase family)